MKASFLIAATTAVVVLVGCGPPKTWYRQETTAEQIRMDAAACEYAALQQTPYPPPATPTHVPYDAPWYEHVAQGFEDAGATLGAGLGAQAYADELKRLCMEAQGYNLVAVDSRQAQEMLLNAADRSTE
jgi:ABC-type sugar transport system substrate-binding protein